MKNYLVFAFAILATIAQCNGFDDERVINAALRTEFERSETNEKAHDSGGFIVLSSEWTGKARPSFVEKLKNSLQVLQVIKDSPDQLSALQKVRKSIDRDPQPVTSEPAMELRDMILDERIVIDHNNLKSYSLDERAFYERRTASNSAGRASHIRLIGFLSQPCYSNDKRYAYLCMRVPLTHHSMDIEYFLERIRASWKVISVVERYYL